MKKNILFSLLILMFVFASCSKESISSQLIGTWRTDWKEKPGKPLKELSVNEGISFFEEPGEKDHGRMESAFVGSTTYKNKKVTSPVDFIITVPGTWTVVDGDDIVLRYEIGQMEIIVNHEEQHSNIMGAIGDVATDLFSGNWGGAIDKTIGAVTSGDVNKTIDSESRNKLLEFFRQMLAKRNQEKITYHSVEIEGMTMTCDPGGIFSSKITYYKTDSTPVHFINAMEDFQEAQQIEENKSLIEELDSTINQGISNLDSTLNEYKSNLIDSLIN